jgi:hypothetical protein
VFKIKKKKWKSAKKLEFFTYSTKISLNSFHSHQRINCVTCQRKNSFIWTKQNSMLINNLLSDNKFLHQAFFYPPAPNRERMNGFWLQMSLKSNHTEKESLKITFFARSFHSLLSNKNCESRKNTHFLFIFRYQFLWHRNATFWWFSHWEKNCSVIFHFEGI